MSPAKLLTAIAVVAISLLNSGAAPDPATTNAPVLRTRTFKVDTNAFFAGLEMTGAITNGQQSPSASDVSSAVIRFFAAVGVDLKAPKSVFFKDRQGMLFVRATDEDLELIEQALIVLTNPPPPEVTLTVRFLDLEDEDMFRPGYEWFLKMVAKSGSSPSGVGGILTEPQFNKIWKTLKDSDHAKLLNEGQATTLSGRQANFDLGNFTGASQTNSGPSIDFYRDEPNSPSTLDVVPYVETNGYTIQLVLTPTATEYLEEVAPSNFLATGSNSSSPLAGPLPLPHMRVHQMTTSCIVWDGQTAILFLKPPYVLHKKNIMIFVTATIVDDAGNRKNSAESLPFSQNAVPPQPTH